jgi:hypothetical protein
MTKRHIEPLAILVVALVLLVATLVAVSFQPRSEQRLSDALVAFRQGAVAAGAVDMVIDDVALAAETSGRLVRLVIDGDEVYLAGTTVYLPAPTTLDRSGSVAGAGEALGDAGYVGYDLDDATITENIAWLDGELAAAARYARGAAALAVVPIMLDRHREMYRYRRPVAGGHLITVDLVGLEAALAAGHHGVLSDVLGTEGELELTILVDDGTIVGFERGGERIADFVGFTSITFDPGQATDLGQLLRDLDELSSALAS